MEKKQNQQNYTNVKKIWINSKQTIHWSPRGGVGVEHAHWQRTWICASSFKHTRMGEQTTRCMPGPCPGGAAINKKRKTKASSPQQIDTILGVPGPMMCDIMYLWTSSFCTCVSTHTCRMAVLTSLQCVLMEFPLFWRMISAFHYLTSQRRPSFHPPGTWNTLVWYLVEVLIHNCVFGCSFGQLPFFCLSIHLEALVKCCW